MRYIIIIKIISALIKIEKLGNEIWHTKRGNFKTIYNGTKKEQK